MTCYYQLFPFIFLKFNLEQIYFPKIQNIKKTKNTISKPRIIVRRQSTPKLVS